MIGRRNKKGQICRATDYSLEEYAALLRARLKAKSALQPSGCIEWQGASVRNYGQIRVRNPVNKLMLAHRLAWVLHYGTDPAGLLVCHKCDNPRCINVDHLFVGTTLDNMQDMAAKGRSGDTRGSKSGKSKLTEEDAVHMLALSSSGVKQAEIAKKFNIHPAHVSRIISGKRWAHLIRVA